MNAASEAENAAAVWVSIDALVPWEKNPRQNDQAVPLVAESIKRFGFSAPLIARSSTREIIAGHTRLRAAQSLGLERVPVRFMDLSEEEAHALALADNKLNEAADWDISGLSSVLQELQDASVRIIDLGWSESEIEVLLSKIHEPAQIFGDEDDVPKTQPEPVTVRGDTWILGAHRLRCGDSTSVDDVAELMNGLKANLCFTDPPYGMSYGGGRAAGSSPNGALVKAHGMIINDDLEGDDLISLVRDAIASAKTFMLQDAALYACFTWRTYAEFEAALKNCGCEIKACIVWDKKSIGLGNSHYRPQHEFIFYCGGEWFGDKAQSDVWHMSRGSTSAYVHPTQKPVELIEKAIENSSKNGDIVIDCFGGSGSTLIACEKTGRRARLMELDPKYVDVIVQRWQNATGKKALLESTGQTFADVQAGRKVS